MIGRTKEPGTYGLDLLAFVWPDGDIGVVSPSPPAGSTPKSMPVSAMASDPVSANLTEPPQLQRKSEPKEQARSHRHPVRLRTIGRSVKRRRSRSGRHSGRSGVSVSSESGGLSGESSSSEGNRGSGAKGLTEAFVLDLYDWYQGFGTSGMSTGSKPRHNHSAKRARDDAEETMRRVLDRLDTSAGSRDRAPPQPLLADHVSAERRRSAREAAERAVDRVAAKARES